MKQISMDLGGAVHSLARARYTKRQRDALTLERCLREVMHPQTLQGWHPATPPCLTIQTPTDGRS